MHFGVNKLDFARIREQLGIPFPPSFEVGTIFCLFIYAINSQSARAPNIIACILVSINTYDLVTAYLPSHSRGDTNLLLASIRDTLSQSSTSVCHENTTNRCMQRLRLRRTPTMYDPPYLSTQNIYI